MTDAVVLIDGDLVGPGEGRISVLDHGFLFGDSVYEVVRTRGGEPFLLAEHLDRLRRSADEIYMEVPHTDSEIGEQVRRAVAEVGALEAYVRIVVTRGEGEIELHPGTCSRRRLVLIGRPLVPPPERFYREGVRIAVVPRRRNPKEALSPAAKTGNYLNNVLAMVEARERGADDAVMLNADGDLTEATTANVFLVAGAVARTPSLDCGILEGITRSLVIRLLHEAGVRVEEGRYGADALRGADEAFLTSTTRDVMPIGQVDGEPLGESPGPVAAAALRSLEAFGR